jgi:hypothetical protein
MRSCYVRAEDEDAAELDEEELLEEELLDDVELLEEAELFEEDDAFEELFDPEADGLPKTSLTLGSPLLIVAKTWFICELVMTVSKAFETFSLTNV